MKRNKHGNADEKLCGKPRWKRKTGSVVYAEPVTEENTDQEKQSSQSRFSRFEQALFCSVAHQFYPAVQIELGHQVCAVAFDGTHTDRQ